MSGAGHVAQYATQPTSPHRTAWTGSEFISAAALSAARHEDLTVDAEATLGGFEDLHKKSLGGIGGLFRGAKHYVGNPLYHGTLLFEREDARRNMDLHQRCAEGSGRNGSGQNAGRGG